MLQNFNFFVTDSGKIATSGSYYQADLIFPGENEAYLSGALYAAPLSNTRLTWKSFQLQILQLILP
jgi:hypothetical protein